MTARKRKPQPPVFTEANKKTLALMELFREDMRVIEAERDQVELNTVLSSFEHNPLQFKYTHYGYLFKVWLAGHSQGANHGKTVEIPEA